jgi:hypothetical protein
MKLGSLHDVPEACAEGVARQQLSLALLSPDRPSELARPQP